MNRINFLESLQKRLRVDSDAALAARIGWQQGNLSKWRKRRGAVGAAEAARFVVSAAKQSAKQAVQSAIRPIIEFYPLSPRPSKSERYWELLDEDQDKNAAAVQRILEEHGIGVYLFYDSMGRVIYVGRTSRQSLWKEMRSAFNRPNRRSVIFLVNHPTNKIDVQPAYDQHRQIMRYFPPLFDVALYFSAYEADTSICNALEAFLIRAVPNNLVNRRIEKIPHKKK